MKPAVVWFTGLSGSGKSTIAQKVVAALKRRKVNVEYLDGDALREVFPTGFTKKERDEHIKRVGFMAALLERHGVVVVCSFVSPYRAARAAARKMCRRFIEVHVATPLAVCEKRDPKGLYAKARRGETKNFTGIDDPYEAPLKAELVIDASKIPPAEAVSRVLRRLV